MVKIDWLPQALDDVQRLYEFLYEQNPEAAKQASISILKGADILSHSPRLGRPMPDETGRREIFVAFGAGAYVIRYKQVNENLDVIIRVWHSKENR